MPGAGPLGAAGFSATVAGTSTSVLPAVPAGLVPRARVRTPNVSPSLAVKRRRLRVSCSSAGLRALSSRRRRKTSIRSWGVACAIRRGLRTSQRPDIRREARFEGGLEPSPSSGGGRLSDGPADRPDAGPDATSTDGTGRRSIRLHIC